MALKHVLAAGSMAAILAAASGVQAQETHTLVPHFPDNFKTRTTIVSDNDQTMQGKPVATHSKIVMLTDMRKTADGYHATLTVESADSKMDGADGTPQAAMAAKMSSLLTTVGHVEATYDKDMMPVRIDNLDDIKTKVKALMTADTDPQKKAAGEAVYNMMFANLTPESAAQFLKQMKQSSMVFNRPLVVGVDTPVTGDPMTMMGATFRMTGTAKLVSWTEGKSARLTYSIAPTDEDMHNFVVAIVKNVVNQMAAGQDAKVKDMMDRMLDGMKVHMTSTCDVDVDLVDTANSHGDCTTRSDMTMDLRKMFTEDDLKAKPELAQKLQVITMTQSGHVVVDSVVVN
ncbi:hypothetical protein [Asticcacaulis solisilvae]|uniref:hypothetical protein n=1 Tax=Asticcacaulis solisilvae TaxID=1217274 RepID=UPI003FD6C118